MKITLSVIKADIGGFVGHSGVHPEVLQKVQEVGLKEVEKVISLIVKHWFAVTILPWL